MTRLRWYEKEPDRFWARVDRSGGPDACWPWKGKDFNRNGYGRVWSGPSRIGAHLVAYTLAVGPIPEGHVLRHTCDNRPCCNPAHHLPGTQQENVADAIERRRFHHVEVRRGAAHPGHRFDETAIVGMLALLHAGESEETVCLHFDISRRHLRRLLASHPRPAAAAPEAISSAPPGCP